MKQPWFFPGPSYGYMLVRIDDHPWNTLLTMKEVVQLEPASIEFTGPHAEGHAAFWNEQFPGMIGTGKKPCMVLDTTATHPHNVEVKPRKPFEPFTDR